MASGADVEGSLGKAAVVAENSLLPGMKRERHAAMRTAQNEPAEPAVEKIEKTATVQKNEALLAAKMVFSKGSGQTRSK